MPDFESTTDNLAGALSHDSEKLPLRYIGPLSRLRPGIKNQAQNSLLLLLSGPEPQRSLLEELLLQQLVSTTYRITLVRGLVGKNLPLPAISRSIPDFQCYDYLEPEALSHEINRHELVVSRSGYSTIMDLQHLCAKAVFVPTPGQAEQEYLAQRLSEQKIAAFQPQNELNLTTLIANNSHFSGFLPCSFPDYDQLWRETLSSLEA